MSASPASPELQVLSVRAQQLGVSTARYNSVVALDDERIISPMGTHLVLWRLAEKGSPPSAAVDAAPDGEGGSSSSSSSSTAAAPAFYREKVVRAHDGFVNALVWCPHSRRVASISHTGEVRLWTCELESIGAVIDPVQLFKGQTVQQQLRWLTDACIGTGGERMLAMSFDEDSHASDSALIITDIDGALAATTSGGDASQFVTEINSAFAFVFLLDPVASAAARAIHADTLSQPAVSSSSLPHPLDSTTRPVFFGVSDRGPACRVDRTAIALRAALHEPQTGALIADRLLDVGPPYGGLVARALQGDVCVLTTQTRTVLVLRPSDLSLIAVLGSPDRPAGSLLMKAAAFCSPNTFLLQTKQGELSRFRLGPRDPSSPSTNSPTPQEVVRVWSSHRVEEMVHVSFVAAAQGGRALWLADETGCLCRIDIVTHTGTHHPTSSTAPVTTALSTAVPMDAPVDLRAGVGAVRLHGLTCCGAAVHPSGSVCASGDFEGRVLLWRVDKSHMRLPGQAAVVCSCSLHDLAPCTACSPAHRHSLGVPVGKQLLGNSVRALAWLDERALLAGLLDGTVALIEVLPCSDSSWQLSAPQQLLNCEASVTCIRVAHQPDSGSRRTVAVSATNGSVSVLALERRVSDGTAVTCLAWLPLPPGDHGFGPGAPLLASVSDDRTARVYVVTPPEDNAGRWGVSLAGRVTTSGIPRWHTLTYCALVSASQDNAVDLLATTQHGFLVRWRLQVCGTKQEPRVELLEARCCKLHGASIEGLDLRANTGMLVAGDCSVTIFDAATPPRSV